MKTIGLIGGMSWESSAEYYRRINTGVRERLGSLRSAQIVLHSIDFGPIEQAQREARWDDAGIVLADSARRLQAAGADCVMLATNTMHMVADSIQAATDLPFLHIADPVGRAASAAGWQRVGLLGTAFTMEQPFLVERLAQRHGLQVLVPPPPERALVHRVIYEELCAGILRGPSRQAYVEVLHGLAAAGAEAVVLGCTEIGLLIRDEHSPVPLLDTTALHAQAAVDFALA
ncbi:MAG: aspartate/glutamate racemase family protein [Betaproteobacteria bacterium]|nr:aspartate/glutamate racemase family protein [Betaproteobacteria bacterium]